MNQGAWIGVVVSVFTFVIFFLIARSIVHYVKKTQGLKRLCTSGRLRDTFSTNKQEKEEPSSAICLCRERRKSSLHKYDT